MPPDGSIVTLPFPDLKGSLERARDYGEAVARRHWESQFETWQEPILWGGDEIACPHCGTVGDLHPRGWQPRKLKSNFGELAFRLRRATCGACGVTSSPVPGLVGLAPRQRLAPDLEAKAAEWVGRLPYAALSALLGHPVSARTLRRAVLRMAERLEASEEGPWPTEGWVLLVDQSMVPIGPSHRGSHMTLALVVTRRRDGPRPSLEVQVLLLDTEMPLPMALKTLALLIEDNPPALILHDGDPTLVEGFARLFPAIPRQRCLWHLERGLGFALWQDGLAKEDREPLQKELRQALYAPDLDLAQAAYRRLACDLRKTHLLHAAGFLEDAQPDAFTFRQALPALTDAIRTLVAQSPVERQFREVNRRADIGCRWSPEGLHAVLFLAIVQRLNAHNLPFLEDRQVA